MGRSDHEDLPPVEVLGAGPSISSVQEVSTRGPMGPRGRRGLLIGLVAAGLLAGGVLLGDDDGTPTATEPDEETTTTRHGPTTTRPSSTTTRPSTTTTAPTGPLFAGHDLQGWILSGNQSGWTMVDIATGARIEPELPFDDPYSTRPVTGGVVLRAGPGGEARYYDLRIPAEAREPVSLGPADQILSTVDGDKVWLVTGTNGSPPEPRARLVDLSGRVLRSFALPPGPYVTATPAGVLLTRGGRVYLAAESGVEAIAVGELVGAVGSSALVFTCNDDATSCSVDLRTTSGTLIGRLPGETSLPDFGWVISTAEDGRFSVVTHLPPDASSSMITLVEPDGQTIATIDAHGYIAEGVSWLPGDAGLVAARNGRIAWIHPTSNGWVVDDIPGLDLIDSAGLLAVFRE